MAKTKGPLLSLDAHGSLGRMLTYSHRKSGRQVRKYTKPLVAASPKQRGQRRLTEFLVAQWQNMSAGDKATWEANARLSGPNITGYHYFLREAQRDLYTHTGLCGYWHCNEIVGGQVLDLSGNGNHGTLEPGYPANAPVLVDSDKTKLGKALLYDGVDEYVDCGSDTSLDIQSNISILFRAKPTLQANYKDWMGKGKYIDPSDKGWRIEWHLGNNIYFIIHNSVGAVKYSTPIPVDILTQQCLVFTYNGAKIRAYKNGAFVVEDATNLLIASIPQSFMIGRTAQEGYFTGIIDEVCIYNRVLSTDEIATRYKFAMREVD